MRWDPASPRSPGDATGYWVEIVEQQATAPRSGEDAANSGPLAEVVSTVKVGRVRRLVGADLARRNTETYKGQTYRVWYAVSPDFEGKPMRMLVEDSGKLAYRVDMSIMGQLTKRERDDGSVEEVKREFDAPKTQVMGLIINGVLKRDLNWSMVLIGAMIAITLELCGISALAFAVGVYVPIQYSTPIFMGGVLRWLIEFKSRKPAAAARDEAKAIAQEETSPAVLLSSGYIAGGSLAGMLVAFLEFYPPLRDALNFNEPVREATGFFLRVRQSVYPGVLAGDTPMAAYILPLAAFAVLMAAVLVVGLRKQRPS